MQPVLLGEWSYASEGKTTVLEIGHIPASRTNELAPAIRAVADNGYLVTRKDSIGNTSAVSFVFLALIGNNFYLDFFPADNTDNGLIASEFKQHFIKMHRCYKINLINPDKFQLSILEESFLDDLIEKNKIRISYETVSFLDKKRVITAQTDELQKYLKKYGDEPKAFSSIEVFVRKNSMRQ